MNLGSIQWREYMKLHFDRMLLVSSWWAEARLKELSTAWTGHVAHLTAQEMAGAKIGSQKVVAQQFVKVFNDGLQRVRSTYTFKTDIFLDY
jgi:hypothetical protein